MGIGSIYFSKVFFGEKFLAIFSFIQRNHHYSGVQLLELYENIPLLFMVKSGI